MSEWLKCDFHSHSLNSDGRDTPEAMIAEYEQQGFDAVSITDNGIITRVASDKLLVILGTEFAYTEGPRGGFQNLLMLFVTRMPITVTEAISRAANIYVAHPITWPGRPRTFPRGVEGVESVNAMYGVRSGLLGRLSVFLERWKWRKWRQIGCSNAHSVHEIGTVYTMIKAEKTNIGIRCALLEPAGSKNRKIVIDWKKIRELGLA